MSFAVRDLASWNVPSEVARRVAHTMRRHEEGKSDDLRSPLFDGMDDEEILSGWRRATRSLVELVPPLQEKEEAESSKFGSRSIAIPWMEFKDSVYGYFQDRGGRELDVVDKPSKRLVPMDPRNTVKSMVLNTSAGLPRLGQKRDRVEVTLAHLASELEQEYPAILYTRTQEGRKTRPVWAWPFADTILEQTYYRVLLPYLKTLGWRAALLGPDRVDSAVTHIFNARVDGEKFLSIDFSQYDASLQPRILRPAMRYLLGSFQDQEAVEQLINRMITIGLVTPDGVLVGEHGMSSGSSWTNEGDSISQHLIANEFDRFGEWTHQVQGDDGLYLHRDPEGLIRVFEEFGLEVNREKSVQSEEYATFLQRLYHPSYRDRHVLRGVYSTTRALNRVVHLERWPESEPSELRGAKLSGSDFFAIRTISILENAKYHPWFKELVAYVAQNDRNQLRFSSSGLERYIRKLGDKGAAGEAHKIGNFATATGFLAFDTVKELRKI